MKSATDTSNGSTIQVSLQDMSFSGYIFLEKTPKLFNSGSPKPNRQIPKTLILKLPLSNCIVDNSESHAEE